MFRTGGSTGSGITSGLKRQGYETGKTVKDALELYDAMKKAGKDEGLYETRSRLPRFLTQFGLNLMGMAPQGNIFQTAALAARDPYTAYASGKDQEAAEQNKLNQAILGDAFEMAAGLNKKGDKKAYQIEELEIFEKKSRENNRLRKENEQLDIEITTLNPEKPAHQTRIDEINKKKVQNQDTIKINKGAIKQITGGSKMEELMFKAFTEDLITRDEYDTFMKTGKLPAGLKEGGRAGYQQGMMVEEQETISEQMPKPMGPAGAQTSSVQPMDFATLRARLPREITDDIVRILAESEQALTDFANIRTQEDVDQFNQTYNVNLVLPQEA